MVRCPRLGCADHRQRFARLNVEIAPKPRYLCIQPGSQALAEQFRLLAYPRYEMRLRRGFQSRLQQPLPQLQRSLEGRARRPSNFPLPFQSLRRIAWLAAPYFRPACFKMLFCVPRARSSLGFPGTVTRPGLDPCLYWRWLPFVATSAHPSWCSNFSISMTFTS